MTPSRTRHRLVTFKHMDFLYTNFALWVKLLLNSFTVSLKLIDENFCSVFSAIFFEKLKNFDEIYSTCSKWGKKSKFFHKNYFSLVFFVTHSKNSKLIRSERNSGNFQTIGKNQDSLDGRLLRKISHINGAIKIKQFQATDLDDFSNDTDIKCRITQWLMLLLSAHTLCVCLAFGFSRSLVRSVSMSRSLCFPSYCPSILCVYTTVCCCDIVLFSILSPRALTRSFIRLIQRVTAASMCVCESECECCVWAPNDGELEFAAMNFSMLTSFAYIRWNSSVCRTLLLLLLLLLLLRLLVSTVNTLDVIAVLMNW